jgi:hydroxypyruvate reductase
MGGRNQEVALSAAAGIEYLHGVLIGALGTDGIDGPTEAAGAIVDGQTAARVRVAGMNLYGILNRNDSHAALDASGDLVVTGPTGTNVADLYIVLVGDDPQEEDVPEGGT